MGVLVVTPLIFLGEIFIRAPMGKSNREGWGPTVSQRVGWVVMEFPAAVGFPILFALGPNRFDPAALLLCSLWLIQYVDRAFIYPMLMRPGPRPLPWVVVLSGVTFQAINTWLNASAVGALGTYGAAWLLDPRLVSGVALFATGYAINRHSDRILRHLRAPGETGYRVPRGGMFRWVSCPHYLGEIIMWMGWALATWSLAGLSFALFTAANIGPRAWHAHQWYRRTFSDYPPDRRALIPLLL
jgi:hypothetical protein